MVTIKDVAKAANVSHMTVSRAFQPNSSIKKETREKILAIAKQLNYVPNYSAKSLVMSKQFSIGLFFSSLVGTSEIFLGEMLNCIYQKLPENYLLSVNSIDKTTNNLKFGQLVGRFDGIILVTQSTDDQPFIDYVMSLSIPLVVVNRKLNDEKIYNVYSDETIGIDEMVSILAQKGIATVGIIKGIDGFYSSEIRYQAFVKFCQLRKIQILDTAILQGKYNIESGYHAMNYLVQKDCLPDMIFCCNDDMAIGALQACRENKILVPEQLALVGFDDTVYSRYQIPALSTIHKPYKEMAEKGMDILLDLLNEKMVEKKQHIIKSYFLNRDSL